MEKLRTNREEYDLIASLGGCCSVSGQLKHRGKRTYSLMLDHSLMSDERPVRALPELLRTHFKDLCLPENMVEFEPPVKEYRITKRHLEDKSSGYRWIHQFTVLPSDAKKFAEQRAVLLRRRDRFFAKASAAKNALFILQTTFAYDSELLVDIYDALAETFQGVDIELVGMQFSAGECAVREFKDGKVKLLLAERPHDIVYDNQFTAPEWRFMDYVKVAGLPLPKEIRKKKLIIKWAYKLWRTLGKFLENRNAGCVNMRFYKFNETD